ncbi:MULTISPECIES: phage virion morphogenesis protein [unclassified Saccharibacter]|uniref:phage virion morphogenesis protein n=1 Tax=unclassified Saccharibacter TaxID=2648722 RepID=UPI001324E5E9|nr:MULTISPECIES: phage virion morphogenesis protein [unclassified Saccharibacter]MXV35832.1 phage virion morphogenesis protein [Saccharibacter sp. EH611]MXV57953.1 phage virion morphogenesis protein [Saccharibacter sp. EH70]MXV66348.1 phage virion morphogenesis protein [Saccharibacter sp. EH60]
MALIKISGNTDRISAALSRLEKLGREPNALLSDIGLKMVDRTKERIEREVSPDGSPFAPLNPLYASTKKGPGILRESGSLRRTIYKQIEGNRLIWGSNMNYAAVHQFGAIIKPKTQSALEFSIGGRVFKRQSVTIPARPYLGFNEADRQATVETLQTFFRRCLAG